MQFLVNPNIDFMKYRKVFVWVSVALLLVSVVELIVDGLNLGIDFAGGTQMTVRLAEEPQIDVLRDELASAGLGDVAIQRFGDASSNDILIKVPVQEGSEEGSAPAIIAALNAKYGQSGGFDLNQNGSVALADRLFAADPDNRRTTDDTLDPEGAARTHYEAVAAAVLGVRTANGLLTDWQQIAGAEGVSDAVLAHLQSDTQLGAFSVQSNDNVGPQIGEELTRKGRLAIIFSLVGMLFYIWYRFELRFGVGALVAVFHDFLIVLGLYALTNYEFNLPSIAAFLTLVGYSVNDTVVIFDRVRENMRKHRRMPLVDVMNVSINQTLSRTVLTSGTTLMTVGCLYFLGGGAIRDFAFVLLIGVIIGTYSSIFVASPFALLWEKWFGRDAREARARRKLAKA